MSSSAYELLKSSVAEFTSTTRSGCCSSALIVRDTGLTPQPQLYIDSAIEFLPLDSSPTIHLSPASGPSSVACLSLLNLFAILENSNASIVAASPIFGINASAKPAIPFPLALLLEAATIGGVGQLLQIVVPMFGPLIDEIDSRIGGVYAGDNSLDNTILGVRSVLVVASVVEDYASRLHSKRLCKCAAQYVVFGHVISHVSPQAVPGSGLLDNSHVNGLVPAAPGPLKPSCKWSSLFSCYREMQGKTSSSV